MPEPNESVELAAEAADLCGELQKPPMKHSDTKDSISSVESDSAPVVPCEGREDGPTEEEDERANLADQSDSGSEGSPEKDSGCEGVNNPAEDTKDEKDEEEPPFVPPDDELVEKIIAQVEFYFSDVNITKDAFLLKHVKRNKEGYVSLKLISSFKRVKHIAKDWRVVAYALAKSTKLQINEAGTKLRRVDPLPAYDQTTPSRTVVAIDLPLEKPTIENVAEMFRTCGEIALIRILRPGNPIPADVRHFVNKHPEMNGTVSALVEFVRTESAHNAINRQDWDWRHGVDHSAMKVLELNAPPSSDRKKRTQSQKKNPGMTRLFDSEYSSSCASGSEAEGSYQRQMRLQRRCSSPHMQRPGDHWTQRRWSRDSGSDSPSSSFSRSRSNSGVFYIPDHVRRMSAGWDSGSDSYGSGRSRSNSGVSLADRRFSVQSKDSDCCCCGHYNDCRRMSYCHDSGSEGYGSNRSRCNSGASDIKRKDSGEYYCPKRFIQPDRRISLTREPEGPYCPRIPMDQRRVSVGSDTESSGKIGFQRQRSSSGIHLPENIVRMPRGPDGGRGFVAPPPVTTCHTLVE
ncbi:la-related protein 6 [Macrosteles quadrilineatus]|uniref:la-related protein 6 n=1 Tax=Macrosteles quadrilineatus TaxID=74068 RepID=UPI0023E0A192|nr:la-related protein 6 [Macrosteles quadrilineatus]